MPVAFSQHLNVSTLGSARRLEENWCEEREDARENKSGLRFAAQLGEALNNGVSNNHFGALNFQVGRGLRHDASGIAGFYSFHSILSALQDFACLFYIVF